MTPLVIAEDICNDFARILKPTTSRVLVVGSIRRRKQTVNDGDIIYIPTTVNAFGMELILMKQRREIQILSDGMEIKRIRYRSLEIDLYHATQQTWGTLQLIRTGSKEHNIMLAEHAHTLGMTLKADGSGLMDRQGHIIPINHEQDIFLKLQIPFKMPEERN